MNKPAFETGKNRMATTTAEVLTDDIVDQMAREHGVDLDGPAFEVKHRASDQLIDEDDSSRDESDDAKEMESALITEAMRNPLDEVSLTSALLGVVGGASALLAIQTLLADGFWPLPLYVTCLVIFHFLEYYITARYNRPKVRASSFLLRNGSTYLCAHALALSEAVLELYFVPPSWRLTRGTPITAFLGLALLAGGQFLRSAAMIHAATNFSHVIVRQREQKHKLVRTGVYSFSRHPSYSGFFFWALGTQVLLANPISFVTFVALLWIFFSERIRDEEAYLLVFFGEEYVDYRKTTPTRIPFIE